MNNREKYSNAFRNAFELGENDNIESLKYQDIAAWDSVGHMSLISELEDAFDIMMDADDIIDFSSYEVGIELLKKYNVEI